MGKKLEITQWVLIILIIVYLVGISTLAYIIIPETFNRFDLLAETTGSLDYVERLISEAGKCEVKEDCVYGLTTINYKKESGSIEGCFNKDKIDTLTTKPFQEECICINNQCGHIS